MAIRPRSPRRRPSVCALSLSLGLCLLVGCASFGRTLEGAELYEEGTQLLSAGDATAAVTALERAAALVPHASEIQNHLGLAYAAEGRDDEAERAFERALELDCDNLAAEHNLARLTRFRWVADDSPRPVSAPPPR